MDPKEKGEQVAIGDIMSHPWSHLCDKDSGKANRTRANAASSRSVTVEETRRKIVSLPRYHTNVLPNLPLRGMNAH